MSITTCVLAVLQSSLPFKEADHGAVTSLLSGSAARPGGWGSSWAGTGRAHHVLQPVIAPQLDYLWWKRARIQHPGRFAFAGPAALIAWQGGCLKRPQ